MPGFSSLGQEQREDAVFQINLISSQTKLFSPPQARFNRKSDQLPGTVLHDPSQPFQLITSQPPRPLHFGEELQTRYRVLSQLAVFDRQHEHMMEKRKMPVDRCIAPSNDGPIYGSMSRRFDGF